MCKVTAMPTGLNPCSWRVALVVKKFHVEVMCSEGNLCIQGEANKVLRSDNTQTIDDIQKCFIQKF